MEKQKNKIVKELCRGVYVVRDCNGDEHLFFDKNGEPLSMNNIIDLYDKYKEDKKTKDNSIKMFLGKVWAIEISEDNGVKFNREDFPNFTQEDFANEFIKILEKNFNVNFTKKD